MLAIIVYSFTTAVCVYLTLFETTYTQWSIIFAITACLLSLYLWIYSIAKVINENIIKANIEVNVAITKELLYELFKTFEEKKDINSNE